MTEVRGLARIREQAHPRLAAAFSEGERQLRADVAALLRQLADDVATLPLPTVHRIVAAIQQVNGVRNRPTVEDV